ncbi:hypothetical protein XENORESO_004043, partial [Xenotaenia resolanae]
NVVVRSHARVSSLTLKNVQFTYAGRYLCTASNSIGEVTQQVFLEVRYAPKIMGFVAAYTWEGNPVNISCEVTSNPRASVIWFRDGTELPSGNSTNIKIFNTPTISHLEITPESQNDFGSYNCTATNVIGTESKEFLLIQAEVPSSPKIEEVQPFSSTAVVEFEEPNSLGGVPILKYRVEWRLPGKEWSSEEYKAEEGGNPDMTVADVRTRALTNLDGFGLAYHMGWISQQLTGSAVNARPKSRLSCRHVRKAEHMYEQ